MLQGEPETERSKLLKSPRDVRRESTAYWSSLPKLPQAFGGCFGQLRPIF
jgi:hypothetical protein